MRSSTLVNERSHPCQRHFPVITTAGVDILTSAVAGWRSFFGLLISSCFAFPANGMPWCLLSERCSSACLSASCVRSRTGTGNPPPTRVAWLVVITVGSPGPSCRPRWSWKRCPASELSASSVGLLEFGGVEEYS